MTGPTVWDQFPPKPTMPRLYSTPQPPEEPEDWRARALCAQTDPELFHPEGGRSPEPALKVCAACPVRELCLQWALDNDERWGVLGGLTANQRTRLINGTNSEKRTPAHGTNTMYNRGCHNEDTCPRNARGLSCSGAHRQAQAAWRRHNGGAA